MGLRRRSHRRSPELPHSPGRGLGSRAGHSRGGHCGPGPRLGRPPLPRRCRRLPAPGAAAAERMAQGPVREPPASAPASPPPARPERGSRCPSRARLPFTAAPEGEAGAEGAPPSPLPRCKRLPRTCHPRRSCRSPASGGCCRRGPALGARCPQCPQCPRSRALLAPLGWAGEPRPPPARPGP